MLKSLLLIVDHLFCLCLVYFNLCVLRQGPGPCFQSKSHEINDGLAPPNEKLTFNGDKNVHLKKVNSSNELTIQPDIGRGHLLDSKSWLAISY